jgi:hypothetical protein
MRSMTRNLLRTILKVTAKHNRPKFGMESSITFLYDHNWGLEICLSGMPSAYRM